MADLSHVPESKRAEVQALLDRVKIGNEKCFAAFNTLRNSNLEVNSPEWNEKHEQIYKAVLFLQELCTALKVWYEDCLYIDKEGKKTKKCLGTFANDFFCYVCPSKKEYWWDEMYSLPRGKQNEKNESEVQTKLF